MSYLGTLGDDVRYDKVNGSENLAQLNVMPRRFTLVIFGNLKSFLKSRNLGL